MTRRSLIAVLVGIVSVCFITTSDADIVIYSQIRQACAHVELDSLTDQACDSYIGAVVDFNFGTLDSRNHGGVVTYGNWPSAGSKAEAYTIQTLSTTGSSLQVDSTLFTENIQTGPPPVSHVLATATSELILAFEVRDNAVTGEFVLEGQLPSFLELRRLDGGATVSQAGPVFLEIGQYELALRWERTTDFFGEVFLADEGSFRFTTDSSFSPIPEPSSVVLLLLFGAGALFCYRRRIWTGLAAKPVVSR